MTRTDTGGSNVQSIPFFHRVFFVFFLSFSVLVFFLVPVKAYHSTKITNWHLVAPRTNQQFLFYSIT
ncbi:hypothetical protein BDV26DRAFT_270834 [Aspergillus bertholletiae]|uniref:Uncharacterized protein n=1 Tax=Aspergillus bertholletiae TaxID=1226010 RepID=A0A5N7AVX7_9EURO|nr:hypothetical protein BDV26DRAFT_270834 [Aspergillus bertholletiae]